MTNTRAMNDKALPWLRLYTDTIDDEKMRLLAFEDRWHFVALLCCKGSGLLDGDDSPDLLRRKLGVKLGLAARELEAMADRLAEVGLIDPDTFQPRRWDARQCRSDTSTARVQAYRERMKRSTKRDVTVSETAQEKDTDTDIELKAKAKADAPSAKRGCRLPRDWTPTDDLIAWALARPGMTNAALDEEIDKFNDHWKSAPSSKGVKLDWSATFRNWIRNAKPSHGSTSHAAPRKLSAQERIEANIRRARDHETAIDAEGFRRVG